MGLGKRIPADPGFIGPAEVGQQEFQWLVRSMPP